EPAGAHRCAVRAGRRRNLRQQLAVCRLCRVRVAFDPGDDQTLIGHHGGQAMKRLLRWIGVILATLAGLACIAYGIAYVLSERAMRRVYEVPRVALSIPTDAASVAEGRRLAVIRGCFGGCHGK